jgi:hypothetical protein
MTIEITGAPETPASDPPDALQQDGVQAQDPASGTAVLITEAEAALCTVEAMGVRRKDRRWVALLSRIFRGRAEGITPEAASLPTPHGVSGPPANGTRDGASVSPFVVALAVRTGAGHGDRCAPSKRRLERRPRRSHIPRR